MHWSRLRRLAFLAAGLALLPAPAGALITVGSLDLYNPGTAVGVEDGLAYIGAYGGRFIVDVSNITATQIAINGFDTDINGEVDIAGTFMSNGLA